MVYAVLSLADLQVKSEFFDALSSAEKEARDYKSKWEALNDSFCKVGGLPK